MRGKTKALYASVVLVCAAVLISTTLTPVSASYFAIMPPSQWVPLMFKSSFWATTAPYGSITVYSDLFIFPHTFNGYAKVKCDASYPNGMVWYNGPDTQPRYFDVYFKGQLILTTTVYPGQTNEIYFTVSVGWFDSGVLTWYLRDGSWQAYYCWGTSNYPAGYYDGWYIS